jgi:hypothetical protein
MALRLIETITRVDGSRTAKVYRDAQWNEWRVRFYTNGAHLIDGDYFTGEKSDAQGTARHFAWRADVPYKCPRCGAGCTVAGAVVACDTCGNVL